MIRRLALAVFLCLAGTVQADPLRVAIFTTELDREGPGLLLRDILRGDEQVQAVAQVIAHASPDIIVLLRFDYDAGALALSAFSNVLKDLGADYPHSFAHPPNSGMMTDVDLDGDGRLRGPRDAQGYGMFSGQNGMAILSRLPIDTAAARDFSQLLWKDLPGATLPMQDGQPFPSEAAQQIQRLSSTGHWEVPVSLPNGAVLRLLVYHATPPVFDGPEDRNGLRSRDESRFWPLLLDGALDWPAPADPVVLVGNANLDPFDGDGHSATIRDLLSHPRLQDPRPTSLGAQQSVFRPASTASADTVAWDAEGEPGNLRVDYILPDAGLTVIGSGVVWPADSDPAVQLLGADGRGASRHRLVWVDVIMPEPAPRFLDPSGGSG